MLDQIPKLLDRRYLTAFLFPAAVFSLALLGVMLACGITQYFLIVSSFSWGNLAQGLIVVWALSFVLSAMNSLIVRILEGYTPIYPWPSRRIRRRFKLKYTRQYRKYASGKKHDESNKEYETRRYEWHKYFPARGSLILPTKFGNNIRAFEDYPRRMYDFESIAGWYRLLAVVPEPYLDLINNARAQVNLWANMHVLFLIGTPISILCGGVGIAKVGLVSAVVGLGCALVFGATSFASYAMACKASLGWGEFVKSAFDLYLGDLRKQLNLKNVSRRIDEKLQWRQFSYAIKYRDAGYLPHLAEAERNEAQNELVEIDLSAQKTSPAVTPSGQ